MPSMIFISKMILDGAEDLTSQIMRNKKINTIVPKLVCGYYIYPDRCIFHCLIWFRGSTPLQIGEKQIPQESRPIKFWLAIVECVMLSFIIFSIDLSIHLLNKGLCLKKGNALALVSLLVILSLTLPLGLSLSLFDCLSICIFILQEMIFSLKSD